MGPTLCARLDDPYGSLNARVWPQGTTFGRARPPLRQVRVQCHRCLADLLQPLGCCHGPEPWRSSTRPVWRPGRRVSASGDCFLAALPQSQNQIKSNGPGERFHVIAWYCFAPMGPTLCARLDDPYGSLNARVWPQGGTFGHARPPLRQVRVQCHRCLADLLQPLGCCHGPEPWRSFTRPVCRPGYPVSSSGRCFLRGYTSRIDWKTEKCSM